MKGIQRCDVHIYIYIWVYIWTYMDIYIHICVCVHVHLCICVIKGRIFTLLPTGPHSSVSSLEFETCPNDPT